MNEILDTTAKKYLRPAEVEAIYSIKPGVLYNLINSEQIISIRLSRGSVKKATRLIDIASLEAYLASLQSQQGESQAKRAETL